MEKSKKSTISKKKKLQIASGVLLTSTATIIIANIVVSGSLVKQISTTKQTQAKTNQQAKNRSDQASFMESNQEEIELVDKILPNETTIVDVVEIIGNLQKSFKIAPSFEFSAVTPTKDNNQTYIPFNMKLHTNLLVGVKFLRSFEKIPYLTNIKSVNVKTPQNLGGPVELIISGRLYVQDPFK